MLAISAIPHHHHHKTPCFTIEHPNTDCDTENNHEETDCFFHTVFNLGQKINESRISLNESYAEVLSPIIDNLFTQTPATKIEFAEPPSSLTSHQKSKPLGLRAPPYPSV